MTPREAVRAVDLEEARSAFLEAWIKGYAACLARLRTTGRGQRADETDWKAELATLVEVLADSVPLDEDAHAAWVRAEELLTEDGK